jgi:hypothetical protein
MMLVTGRCIPEVLYFIEVPILSMKVFFIRKPDTPSPDGLESIPGINIF